MINLVKLYATIADMISDETKEALKNKTKRPRIRELAVRAYPDGHIDKSQNLNYKYRSDRKVGRLGVSKRPSIPKQVPQEVGDIRDPDVDRLIDRIFKIKGVNIDVPSQHSTPSEIKPKPSRRFVTNRIKPRTNVVRSVKSKSQPNRIRPRTNVVRSVRSKSMPNTFNRSIGGPDPNYKPLWRPPFKFKTGLGGFIGGASGILLASKLRTKLRNKYPDLSDEELDNKVHKLMILLGAIGTGTGALIGKHIK